MMYGSTETTPLINVPLDDDSHEQMPMEQFSGDYGYQPLVMDEPVYRPTTIDDELSSRYRGLTRNQKIAVVAVAAIAIGGTIIGLLSYFLSGQEDAVLPTATPSISPSTTTPWTTTTDITTSTASTTTPFMTTTTAPTTTTGTTADPRCAFDPECCDAGQWICG